MVFRFTLTFAALAIAVAVPVQYSNELDHDAPAEYEYSYAVHDDHTGDIKSHQESRKGHAVTGKYELIDSDGYKRIVEYTADEHTGFNAVVHREPTDIKIPIFESRHAPVHGYIQSAETSAHLDVPVHHQYVAPKILTKAVEPIIKVSPVVHKPVHQAPQLKYVAPVDVKNDELNLNTHVTYNAPEFNYHY